MNNIIRSLIAVAVLLLIIAPNMHARGATPPPPPPALAGLGNAGDWLPNGPIFGFRDPLGKDFYGGNFGGDGDDGDFGHEWEGGSGGGSYGGSSDPISPSCGCPGGDCIRINDYKCRKHLPGYCESDCSCNVRVPKTRPPAGTVLQGTCKHSGRFKDMRYGCASAETSCSVVFGKTDRW